MGAFVDLVNCWIENRSSYAKGKDAWKKLSWAGTDNQIHHVTVAPNVTRSAYFISLSLGDLFCTLSWTGDEIKSAGLLLSDLNYGLVL